MFRVRTLALIILGLTVGIVTLAAEPGAAESDTRLRRPLSAPVEAASRVVTNTSNTPESKQTLEHAAAEPSTDSPAISPRMRTRVSIEVAAKPRVDQPNHTSVLRELAASPPFDVSASGRYMVAVDTTGGLVVIDAVKVRRLHPLENSRRHYSLLEISPDARWIAAARREAPYEVDLWRADNGRFLRTIVGEATAKKSLEFDAQTGDLHVLTANGNGQIYSVPAGVLTGGFQAAVGMAAVKPPSASMSIEQPKEGPAPTATAIDPRRTADLPAGGSRVGGARPNPVREAVPREDGARVTENAVASASSGNALVIAPSQRDQPQAEILTPSLARMAAAPMMAEPMMASLDTAALAASEPASAAPPEPFTAAASAPAMAPRIAVTPRSAPMEALAEEEPAISPETIAPEPAPTTVILDDTPATTIVASSNLAKLVSPTAPPPPEEDLASITVHYATNRQRLTVEDREFATYFKNFFFSLPAVVIYASILVALIVFPWMGRRVWAASAVIVGVALLVSMATFEAYVRSELRDELSGELFGSVPTNLNYGACRISVPKAENRSAGELNRPLSVWVLQAPENPEKHFVLQQVSEHKDKDEFYASLSDQLARSADGTSLLFIHGYNVSFEDALFRTAQLAVDLKFRGAPISFSWPSYADPVKYTFDEQNAEVSIPALREFLEDLVSRSGAKRIHIVAHSMGNRVLAGALRAMSPEARIKNKAMFREIVLAAPDIDSRVFQSQVLPHIQDNTQHCTLYASSRDRALMLSRYFHNYQRLGETEPQLIVASGMDTIDASLVDTSLLGHSYIGDVQSIVTDLHELVVVGKRPTERLWLEAELLGELMYWAIRPHAQTAGEGKTNR